MRRAIDPKTARLLIHTASEVCCPHCEGPLRICQHRERFIFRLDGLVHHLCRDKRCPDEQCEGYGTWYRPLVDLRLALPRMSFGLDVVVAVIDLEVAVAPDLHERGVGTEALERLGGEAALLIARQPHRDEDGLGGPDELRVGPDLPRGVGVQFTRERLPGRLDGPLRPIIAVDGHPCGGEIAGGGAADEAEPHHSDVSEGGRHQATLLSTPPSSSRRA